MFICLLFREQTADELRGDDLGGAGEEAWGCAGRVLVAEEWLIVAGIHQD